MNAPETHAPPGPKWKPTALAGGAGLLALAAVLYFALRGSAPSRPRPEPAPPPPSTEAVSEEPAEPLLRLPFAPPPLDNAWRTALPPEPEHPPHFEVTPRGAYAQDAFEDLRDGKLAVLTLGDASKLLVPPALRFKSIPALELVDAVAAYASLDVAWYRNRWVAVLYRKAIDEKVSRMLKDLAATDPAVRAHAAWMGRWVRDPRVFEALLDAARDADSEVARQALRALRAIGWATLLLAHPQRAYPLFQEELKRYGPGRDEACLALSVLDTKTAIAEVGVLLDGWHDSSLESSVASKVLGLLNTGQAFAELERRIKAGEINCIGAAAAHAHFDTPGALKLLAEKWKDEGGKQARPTLAYVLGASRHPDKFKLLPEALNSTENLVARRAIEGLARNGGPKEFDLVLDLLASKHPEAAAAAARTLGLFGAKAWPPLERILEEQKPAYDPKARRFGGAERPYQAALASLGHLGDEQAVAILRRNLSDPDVSLRNAALGGLAMIRGDAVTRMLTEELDHPDSKIAPSLLAGYGKYGGPGAFDLIRRGMPVTPAFSLQDCYAVLAKSDPERALPVVVEALDSADASERQRAKAALEWLDGDDALVLLDEVLKKEGSGAHSTALKVYEKTGATAGLDYLRRRLELLSKPIEFQEASAVGEIGGRGALALLAAPLAGGDDHQVNHVLNMFYRFVGDLDAAGRAEAVRLLLAVNPVHLPAHHESVANYLGILGDESVIPALEAMRFGLKNTTGNRTGLKEIQAMQRIGGPKARAAITRIISDPDDRDALFAVIALGYDGDDEARDLLLARVSIEQNAPVLEAIKKRLALRWPKDAKARDGIRTIDAKLRNLDDPPAKAGAQNP